MRVTGELQRDASLERRLPPAEQVRPGLWSIPVPIPRSPLRYTLTYILEAPDGLLVLDPGWDVDDAWNALVDGLGVIGAGVTDGHGVGVTHVPPDHHGLSARLREASGAWVAMHPDEAASLPARVWVAGDRGDERQTPSPAGGPPIPPSPQRAPSTTTRPSRCWPAYTTSDSPCPTTSP